MKSIAPALMSLALLFASGCATLANGRHQSISFDTKPAGATVMEDGEQLCVTPCAAELKRSSDHAVTLNVPGYYPYRLTLRSKGSNWAALNILIGGLPIVVDLATGSAWYLTPEQVDRNLDKQEGSAVTDSDGSTSRVQVVLASVPQ